MKVSFYKIIICFFMIGYCSISYGENVVPPILISDLPANVQGKSSKELAKLMEHIASWSYQTLLKIPEKGLKSQQQSIEQVIALRKWLQKHKYHLFQLLSFRLAIGIDRAILNEIFRKEMDRHKVATPSSTIFKAGSFDNPLIKHLLSLNTVNEQDIIKYAIGLEGKIANYCQQQSYSIEDYTNGVILGKFSEELNNYVYTLKKYPDTFINKFSNSLFADLTFVNTLILIDKKRDIQMLTDIYFEESFSNNGKDLNNQINSRLLQNQQIRLSTGYNTNSIQIMNTLLSSIERNVLAPYGLGMTIFFLPFINNLS
ncbi:MAG: hypothetical protein QM487_09095 [Candidatus Marithrix sp.]